MNKVLSQNDPEAIIFLIADENLDVPSKDGANNESVSGSHCVENIRKRLSREAESQRWVGSLQSLATLHPL